MKKIVPQEFPCQVWLNLKHVVRLEDVGEYVENVVDPAGMSSIQVKENPSDWEQTTRDFLPFCFKQKGATVALIEIWAHPNMM